MLDDTEPLRNAVKQSFGALSGYVHPSRKVLDERLARAERGEFTGFEGPGVLERSIVWRRKRWTWPS
jgi:hypothetical protein